MNLLALDTSSIACSVALQFNRNTIERHEEQPRQHTRLVMPMIHDVLAEGGADLDRLDAIVLGNGPGSFIGMRIAASVAQGLAFGAGLSIVPVSSMAAVAAQVFAQSDAREVVVAQDAHMSEVYLGRYVAKEGQLELLDAEKLQGIGVIDELDASSNDGRLLAGQGWRRYPDLVSLNEGRFELLADVRHPRARFLLELAEQRVVAGELVAPQDIVPAYLRQKVAKKPA